jgi:exo-1,4-beta-D-glucosaminidase
VNSTLAAQQGLLATAMVLDMEGRLRFTQQGSLNVAADAVVTAVAGPPQAATTFLKLELRDSTGRMVSDNLYWIPARLAELDWDKTTYVNTPAVSYADMRDLAKLPKAPVQATARRTNSRGEVVVELKNTGSSVAFFIHLRANKAGTDEEIVPVFWNDNFISLLPGETRSFTATGLGDAELDVKLVGWNVEPQTITTH